MASQAMLKIGRMAPMRMKEITGNGLLLPLTNRDDAFLITLLGDHTFATFLSGDYQYHGFKIAPDLSRLGLFIPEPVILIDHRSIYDPRESNPSGGLVLQEGRLSISVLTKDGGFTNKGLFPAWGKYEIGSTGLPVGFASWRLATEQNGELVTIMDLHARSEPDEDEEG